MPSDQLVDARVDRWQAIHRIMENRLFRHCT